MKTITEVFREQSERFTGDLDRDVSEAGLGFGEVWAVIRDIIERERGEVDGDSLVTVVFVEALLTGIAYERERQQARRA